MRYLILLAIFTLAGCQSTSNPQKNVMDRNKLYKKSTESACLLKYGALNANYCECHSSVLSQITPDTLKSRSLSGDSSVAHEVFLKMVKNKSQLETCDSKFVATEIKKVDTSIPEYDVPELAKEILAKYKGKIMTPKNREEGKLFLPIGYEYYMNLVNAKPHPAYIQRLTKIEGNAYYFTGINEVNYRENNKKVLYGAQYYLPLNNFSVTEYRDVPKSECSFIIDEICEYKSYGKKRYQMFTTYKDGMWVSLEPSSYPDVKYLVIKIFGVDGLPLYRYRKNLKRQDFMEFQRVEPKNSWIKYSD
jgi:hypothetical protein